VPQIKWFASVARGRTLGRDHDEARMCGTLSRASDLSRGFFSIALAGMHLHTFADLAQSVDALQAAWLQVVSEYANRSVDPSAALLMRYQARALELQRADEPAGTGNAEGAGAP
jgi:hypothetical protein